MKHIQEDEEKASTNDTNQKSLSEQNVLNKITNIEEFKVFLEEWREKFVIIEKNLNQTQ